VGVECDGTDKRYTGGVWHDPSIVNPDASTFMYACVTDGCPEAGDLVMQCKKGYRGPMCAVCEDGYFARMRGCAECKEPQWGLFLAFLAGAALVLLGIYRIVCRYKRFQRYVHFTSVFSHLKVLVSELRRENSAS
jgi:hypothetical protein